MAAAKEKDKDNELKPVSDADKEQFRCFLQFLYRRTCAIAYRINCFMKTKMVSFSNAMILADEVMEEISNEMRATSKKVPPPPRIASMQAMMNIADEFDERDKPIVAANLREFIDLWGGMRCMGTMAANLFKLFSQRYPDAVVSTVKIFYDQWMYFTKPKIDFASHSFTHPEQIPATMKPEQVKYFSWPLAVQTCIYASSQMLSRISSQVEIPVITDDWSLTRQYMTEPEFVLAFKSDEYLFQRGSAKAQSPADIMRALAAGKAPAKKPLFRHILPDVGDIDPNLLQPVTNKTNILAFTES